MGHRRNNHQECLFSLYPPVRDSPAGKGQGDLLDKTNRKGSTFAEPAETVVCGGIRTCPVRTGGITQAKVFGPLVRLGFDVAVFTPASYQRRSLRRPSKRSSNLAAGFALRCFQRLSNPDSDTRRCTWRHNRQTGGLSVTVLSY